VSRAAGCVTAALLVGTIAGAIQASASTRAGHRLATAAIASTIGIASSGAQSRQEAPEAFRRVCVRCHASDRVVEGRRYRSQWEEVLDRMVERGATGTDEDFEIVLDYLVREYGRIKINTAAADEIAHVLHLEAGAADAIVQHRDKHGKFVDFEALAAVPGVPAEELRKRRDAIMFE
jgi:competence protein ComEA